MNRGIRGRYRVEKLVELAAVLCMGLSGIAQTVPDGINYQGFLTDNLGKPLETRDYLLTFAIHDAATGGSVVWGPQSNRVPVVNGNFNVVLGSVGKGPSLLSAFDKTNRYVSIKVDDRPAIEPRQQLLSSPFAIVAAESRLARGIVGDVLTTAEDGKVGIGVRNPETLLHVNGGILEAGLRLETRGEGTPAYLQFRSSSGDPVLHAIGLETSPPGGILTGSTSKALVIAAGGSNQMHFGVNDRVAMTVIAGGNVGIGTIAPATRLHVNGENLDGILRLETSGAGKAAAIQLVNRIGPSILHTIGQETSVPGGLLSGSTARALVISAQGANPIQFGVNERLAVTIADGGNVGVGTKSPRKTLHLKGANPGVLLEADEPGSTNFKIVNGGFGGGSFGLGISTEAPSTLPALFAKNDGRIGIGTIDPRAVLDVAGTTRIRGEVAGRDRTGGPTLTVEGTSEQSGSIVMDIIGPWDNSFQADRTFLRGISSTGTRFSIRGDGQFFASSSVALKTNIVAITDPVTILTHLRGVRFDWKQSPGAGQNVGFIAEEVAGVLPEAVEANGTMVNYFAVIPVLVEAVKALVARTDAHEPSGAIVSAEKDSGAAISELRRSLVQRDNQIQALERRLSSLEAALERTTR